MGQNWLIYTDKVDLMLGKYSGKKVSFKLFFIPISEILY